MPHPTVAPDLDLRELHQALDLELSKLPDKYRLPIVLCDLEARSRKEVARQLKIAEGTLSSRLATGRQKLARRLGRHGLCLAGGALATTLTQQAVFAGPHASLVASTVKAAALAAAGQSAASLISAHVVALSQGVLKTMLLQKLKIMFLVMAGVLAGGIGIGFFGGSGMGAAAVQAGQATQPAAPQRVKADAPEALDGDLLLDPRIQEELRLSKNQVKQLQDASQEADAKNESKKQQIKAIQKKIAELQKQLAAIQKSIDGENVQAGKIHQHIAADRVQAVGKAAPSIISARAAQRVREIHRQRRGLRQLVQDPAVQRMLKLDDEQMMKIEGILKKERTAHAHGANGTFFTTSYLDLHHPNTLFSAVYQNRDLVLMNVAPPILLHPVGEQQQNCAACHGPHNQPYRLNSFHGNLNEIYLSHNFVFGHGGDPKTPGLIMEVLSDAQRRQFLEWLGRPYQSPSWQEIWNKYMKK